MAQPGTGAQAMEKPVQTLLVHAGGGISGENTRSSTGSLELSVPQAAAARAADCTTFDVSYCCRK